MYLLWEVVAYESRATGSLFQEQVWHICLFKEKREREFIAYIFLVTEKKAALGCR